MNCATRVPTPQIPGGAFLILSTQQLDNPWSQVTITTLQQLRPINPKNYEVAWYFIKYIGPLNHYYFILKPTGWEFGKKDNIEGDQTLERQIFLLSGNTFKLTIGKPNIVEAKCIKDRIILKVDGKQVFDYTDKGGGDITVQNLDGTITNLGNVGNAQTKTLAGPGRVGLYGEVCYATFEEQFLSSSI